MRSSIDDGGTRSAARVSLAACGLFVLLLAALHLLRPDLDPSWRFVSEYQLGEHGAPLTNIRRGR